MATVTNKRNNQPSKFFRTIDSGFKKSTIGKLLGNFNASALDEYKRRVVTAIQQAVAMGEIDPKDTGIPNTVNDPEAAKAYRILEATYAKDPRGWDKAAFFKGSDEEEAELRREGLIDNKNLGIADENIETSRRWELALAPWQKDVVNLIILGKLSDALGARMAGQWPDAVKAWFKSLSDAAKEELYVHVSDLYHGRTEGEKATARAERLAKKQQTISKQGDGGGQVNIGGGEENTGASTVKAQRMRQAMLARGERPSLADVTRQLLGDQFAADNAKVEKMIKEFSEDWGVPEDDVKSSYEAIIGSVMEDEEKRIEKLRRQQGTKAAGSMKKIFRTPYEVMGLVWMDLVLPKFDTVAARYARKAASDAKTYFGKTSKIPRTMIDGIRRSLDLEAPGKAQRRNKPPAMQIPTDWTKFVMQFIELASSDYMDDVADLDPELAKRKTELVELTKNTGMPAFVDADFIEALGVAWYAFVLSDLRIKFGNQIDYLATQALEKIEQTGLEGDDAQEVLAGMARDIIKQAVTDVLDAYGLPSVSKDRIIDAYMRVLNEEYPTFPEELNQELEDLMKQREEAGTEEERMEALAKIVELQQEISSPEYAYLEKEINKAMNQARRAIMQKMYNELPEGVGAAIVKNNPRAAKALAKNTESAFGEFADRTAEIAAKYANTEEE